MSVERLLDKRRYVIEQILLAGKYATGYCEKTEAEIRNLMVELALVNGEIYELTTRISKLVEPI